MTTFLRPEAKDSLWRWREALGGGAALALGVWMATTGFGAVFLIGCGLVAFGTAYLVAGVQRGRFRTRVSAAGVVEIDERRITYLGPFGGGVMDVGDMARLAIHPHPAWLMTNAAGERLMIPTGAEGADQLFDVFSALPGISGQDLVHAVRQTPDASRTIWTRHADRQDALT